MAPPQQASFFNSHIHHDTSCLRQEWDLKKAKKRLLAFICIYFFVPHLSFVLRRRSVHADACPHTGRGAGVAHATLCRHAHLHPVVRCDLRPSWGAKEIPWHKANEKGLIGGVSVVSRWGGLAQITPNVNQWCSCSHLRLHQNHPFLLKEGLQKSLFKTTNL